MRASHHADELLREPHPGWVWWWRSWTVVVVGLVLVCTSWGTQTESPGGGWSSLLTATALGCLLPLAVSTWKRASLPYAHDRTMLVLSRELSPDQRQSVHRALRRCRAEDIAPGHVAYARATTSKTNREVVAAPGLVGPVWTQALLSASREFGSAYFWLTLSIATLGTTYAVALIVLQRRRERTVRLIVERELQ